MTCYSLLQWEVDGGYVDNALSAPFNLQDSGAICCLHFLLACFVMLAVVLFPPTATLVPEVSMCETFVSPHHCMHLAHSLITRLHLNVPY